jgi:hypothetical protein
LGKKKREVEKPKTHPFTSRVGHPYEKNGAKTQVTSRAEEKCGKQKLGVKGS